MNKLFWQTFLYFQKNLLRTILKLTQVMWKWKEWPRWTRRVMKFPQPHLPRAAANSREWSVVWKPRIYGTNSTNWAQRWSSLKPGGESQADSPPDARDALLMQLCVKRTDHVRRNNGGKWHGICLLYYLHY